MTKKIIVALVVVALLMPGLSFAASFRAGSNVSLGPSETVSENTYMGGGTVSVSGTVNCDLFAAGGTVYIAGKINRDIFEAGGTVTIVGATAEDVRVAGGTVTIGGNFSGELLGGGGTIIVTPGTTIAKDAYLGGGTITFNGNEAGNLTIGGGTVNIDGTVAGNVLIKNAKKVVIGAHAVIKKNLEYSAASPATIEQGAQVLGATTYHEIVTMGKNDFESFLPGLVTAWWFIKLLMVLTAAYLLWYLRRNDVLASLSHARSRFWRALLQGAGFLVLVPIAVIVLFATIIGAIPAIVTLLVYGAILVLCAPLAAIFVSSLIRKHKTNLRWYDILLGTVVLQIVALIPFIGWLACLIVYLAALGGLITVLRAKF